MSILNNNDLKDLFVGATAYTLGNSLVKYEYTGFSANPYVAMKTESPLTKSELTDKIMDCIKYWSLLKRFFKIAYN